MKELMSEDRRWWWDGRQWQPARQTAIKGWQAIVLAMFVAAMVIFGQLIAGGLDQIVSSISNL